MVPSIHRCCFPFVDSHSFIHLETLFHLQPSTARNFSFPRSGCSILMPPCGHSAVSIHAVVHAIAHRHFSPADGALPPEPRLAPRRSVPGQGEKQGASGSLRQPLIPPSYTVSAFARRTGTAHTPNGRRIGSRTFWLLAGRAVASCW